MEERRRATDTPAGAADTIAQATATLEKAAAVVEPKPNVVVTLAVKGIITITLGALIGAIVLIWHGQNPPDGIIAISSAGMGALGTLLTVRGLGEK